MDNCRPLTSVSLDTSVEFQMNGMTLKSAHVVDPASGRDGIADVRIVDGRIAAVGSFPDAAGDQVVDLSGSYLTPGWIDMHVHAYGTLGFADPDSIGVYQGVTTYVEAGGPGIDTLPEFVSLLGGKTITSLYAGPYIRPMGIIGPGFVEGDVRSLKNIPIDRWLDFRDQHPELLRYLKLAEFEGYGAGPLRMGKGLAELLGLPLYCHIGENQRPGYEPESHEIWDIAQKGDIITHIYHNNGGRILDSDGKVFDFVHRAAARGVNFDLAFGGYNFSWDVAEKGFAQGILPDFISSDLQQFNVIGPAFSLANVMSICLHLGLTLNEVIERVTSKPAKALRLDDRAGALVVGHPADITVFRIEDGSFSLADTARASRNASRRFAPQITFKNGVRYEVDMARCQDDRNWLLQVAEDAPPPYARSLSPQQREFLSALRDALTGIDWTAAVAGQFDLNKATELQDVFRATQTRSSIDLETSLRTVFNVFLMSPFTMQIGLFLCRLDRKFVLDRLDDVARKLHAA